jgi:hypothetical protein
MRRLRRSRAAGARRPTGRSSSYRSLLLNCCLPPPPAPVFPPTPPASPSCSFRFLLPVSQFLPAFPSSAFSTSFCTSVLHLVPLLFSCFPFFFFPPVSFLRIDSCDRHVGSEFCGSRRPQQRCSLSRRVCRWSQQASAPVVSGRPVAGWLAGWLGTTPCDMWHHLVWKNDQFLFSFTYFLDSCVFGGYDIIAHIVVNSLANYSGKEGESCVYTIDGCLCQLLTNSEWTRWVLHQNY